MFYFRVNVIWLCLNLSYSAVAGGEDWWVDIVKSVILKDDFQHQSRATLNITDLSEWMTNLPPKLHDVPLNQLAIPGSHDSGSYWLNVDWPPTPNNPGIVKELGKFRSVRRIIRKWSITQDHRIWVQLEKGIRYIDMRTIYVQRKDDFFVYHGLYGTKSTVIFQQIRDFIDKHPKEVVLIDFNHIVNFTPHAARLFRELLNIYFEDKLYAKNSKAFNITLNDLWRSGKQIIAFYPASMHPTTSNKFWPLSSIYSPWFNTSSLKYLLRKLRRLLMTSSPDRFTVFQGILSPSTWTIITHSSSSLKRQLGLKYSRAITLWLDLLRKSRTEGINIVITDFVTYNDFPTRVIRMNEILL